MTGWIVAGILLAALLAITGYFAFVMWDLTFRR